ncbi:ABC transporter permease [Conexibacter woesei]|uniref:Inner-membrane translocator n=1 Tax=Conexibacter woesei (strain DSM 14684 / CCUG 47730 / CIP 108061 / JCM 11494 / NBRC 100937 / ID131577) TaxID=469383 RepID=D3F6K1_CONWI|nr:ABC transporter permease [Conexibacter woesei]ADB50768.1 inner-membrane translocator [Conexibacter woesei DSM 14684]
MSENVVNAVRPRRRPGRPLGRRLAGSLSFRTIGAVYVWLLLIAAFAIWIPDLFLREETLKSILNQYSITALAALSIIIPLSTGVFDLSIGSTMGLTGIVAAWLLGNTDLSPLVVVVLGVSVGALVGLFNALIVVRMKIDSFIGTLATGSILAAVTLGISGDQILTERVSGSFSEIASTDVAGIQLPVLYMIALMIVIGFFLEQTAAGRYCYATGFNPEVTRLVGVSVDRVRTLALVFSGCVAGFAGVVLTARIQAADPTNGPSYMIPAFSAAFLGATQFRHGRFNPWGTIVAVLMLGTGSVGLLLAGAPTWAPQIFQGVVLIAAVGVTVVQRRPKAARETKPAAAEAAASPS